MKLGIDRSVIQEMVTLEIQINTQMRCFPGEWWAGNIQWKPLQGQVFKEIFCLKTVLLRAVSDESISPCDTSPKAWERRMEQPCLPQRPNLEHDVCIQMLLVKLLRSQAGMPLPNCGCYNSSQLQELKVDCCIACRALLWFNSLGACLGKFKMAWTFPVINFQEDSSFLLGWSTDVDVERLSSHTGIFLDGSHLLALSSWFVLPRNNGRGSVVAGWGQRWDFLLISVFPRLQVPFFVDLCILALSLELYFSCAPRSQFSMFFFSPNYGSRHSWLLLGASLCQGKNGHEELSSKFVGRNRQPCPWMVSQPDSHHPSPGFHRVLGILPWLSLSCDLLWLAGIVHQLCHVSWSLSDLFTLFSCRNGNKPLTHEKIPEKDGKCHILLAKFCLPSICYPFFSRSRVLKEEILLFMWHLGL